MHAQRYMLECVFVYVMIKNLPKAMNAISLSLPLINLHLTSLLKAISDSFVSALKFFSQAGAFIKNQSSKRIPRKQFFSDFSQMFVIKMKLFPIKYNNWL